MPRVALCVALGAGVAGALSATATRTIRRRQLGSSDLVVSDVCLGTMTWGKQNTLEEGVSQLDMAFDEYGINFLDTAEMYPVPTEAATQGETDKTIGEWLRRRGKRDDVVLASKICGASERITWVRGDGRGTRVTRADVEEGVDASLARLGTDYIDLLQIHWPDRYVPIFGADAYDATNEREYVSFLEQLEAMRDMVDAGKVRHVGVSNETPFGVCQFVNEAEKRGDLPRICSIQNSYSLLVRSDFENGLTETCSMTDVGLLAYSPLAGGILSGKYSGDEPPPGARLNLFPGFMPRYKQSLAKEAVGEYERVAAAFGLTPTQLALKWCYTRPHVASTIIGATSLTQLRENVDAYFLDDLPDECEAAIKDIYQRYRDPSKT